MRSRWLLLPTLLILAACTLGQDYRRPNVEAPSAWRIEESEARAVADTAWWEQFQDPVLNGLIAEALTGNKDLLIAAARIEEYRGRYGVARADRFPGVKGEASASRQRITEEGYASVPAGVSPTYNTFQPTLNASWEIDLWGKYRRAAEAARADLLGSEEGRRAAILSLVTSVTTAYVNLLNFDRQLEIARRTVETRKASLDMFTLRFAGGVISQLELSQSQAEYDDARTYLPQLEKAIAQQEHALCILLGRDPGPIPRGRRMDELVLPEIPAGLPSELLERRPDIRQAEQDLVSAQARIGVAKAAYFPSISLTGFFGFASADLSNLFSGPARVWNYGASLSVPIFTAGRITGQVRAAEAVREQSLLRYRQVIQKAFQDVEDALVGQRKSRERLEAQARQVEAVRTYKDLARLRYDNGYSSYLEVLDAERSLFNVELDYTKTQGARFQAMVDLYKALGGGWVTVAEDRARPPDGPVAAGRP